MTRQQLNEPKVRALIMSVLGGLVVIVGGAYTALGWADSRFGTAEIDNQKLDRIEFIETKVNVENMARDIQDIKEAQKEQSKKLDRLLERTK